MEKKTVNTLPKREEIPVEDTWDLEAIYESDEKWEEEFKEIKALLPQMEEYKGKLSESAERLYAGLQQQDEITKKLGKLFTYAHMRYDQDTTNSHYQGLNDRASNLATQVSSALAFVVPEILSIPEKEIEAYLKENKDLQLYEQALDEINRQRPHVLSKEEEAILAGISDVTNSSSNTFGMLNNADMKFPTIKDENGEEVEVTHGRLIRFLESSDRRVRRDAFKAVYETYDKFKNTFASTLSGTVKRDNYYASVRKYDSARQAALDNNNIPEEVYDNLVETVNNRLDLLHRYVDIRKKRSVLMSFTCMICIRH